MLRRLIKIILILVLDDLVNDMVLGGRRGKDPGRVTCDI